MLLFTLNELYKISFNTVMNSFSLFDDNNTKIQKIQNLKIRKSEMIKLNIDKINKQGFIEGNRNNWLFTNTISLLYNGKINNTQVHETLIQLNNNELPIEEINRISKSILKYNIQPNIIKKEHYTKGEYRDELWKNGIHNYKENNEIVFNRQKFGQSVTTKKIITETIKKLINGYKVTYKNNELFTNKNIVKNSGVSKSTVKRYRNQKKLEDKIKGAAFLEFIKDLGKKPNSVKADEPPIRNVINIALKDLLFEDKNTGNSYRFILDKNDKLIFYRITQKDEQIAA